MPESLPEKGGKKALISYCESVVRFFLSSTEQKKKEEEDGGGRRDLGGGGWRDSGREVGKRKETTCLFFDVKV